MLFNPNNRIMKKSTLSITKRHYCLIHYRAVAKIAFYRFQLQVSLSSYFLLSTGCLESLYQRLSLHTKITMPNHSDEIK